MKQILLALPFLILSCAGTGSITTSIEDLTRYSQDPRTYAATLPDSALIIAELQERQSKISHASYFHVWSDPSLNDTSAMKTIHEYQQQSFATYINYPGFGENLHGRDSNEIRELHKNAALPDQFLHRKKGIVVHTTSLRKLPTDKPYFKEFALPGEGFPFDYWQISTIPAGTPIEICHESDQWALVSSHLCSGWIRRDHVAQIDDSTANVYRSFPLGTVISDQTPLIRTNGSYASTANIGMMFPLISQNDREITALIPFKTNTDLAALDTVIIPRTAATPTFLSMTPNNIASISAKMIGQNYGWGGLFGNRDCSQTLQDLFIPFGILLPRNSKYQAYNTGKFIPISPDKSDKEIKAQIIREAIPFATLIRSPGHIMLYVGTINNEPCILHTTWGVKTERFGREGRLVIGKTVITSLDAGKELSVVDRSRSWLRTIEGITILTQPKEPR